MSKALSYIFITYILTPILFISGCQSSASIAKQPLAVNNQATAASPSQLPATVNKQTAAAIPVQPVLQRQSVILDGHSFILIPPFNWALDISQNLIVLKDETEQIRGEITLVGFYNNYPSGLPNHSEILTEEDIDSALGTGKIYVLERSHPAASGNQEKWQEVYAVIPISNKDLAYLFWIKADPQESLEVNKELLRFIINHMETSE